MADDLGAKPPDKRERRPDQEAAFLAKMGKVTQRHDATNDAGLPSKIDDAPGALDEATRFDQCFEVAHQDANSVVLNEPHRQAPWYRKNVHKVWLDLFPDALVADGKMHIAEKFVVDLEDGYWVETRSGCRHDNLATFAIVARLDREELSRRSTEILAPFRAAAEAALAALPVPLPDRKEFERWLSDNAKEFFPAVLPEGQLSECGREWRAGQLAIVMEGSTAGSSKPDAYRKGYLQDPIATLEWVTGERWPWSFERVVHVVADLKKRGNGIATINTPPPKSNGHDRTHAPPKVMTQPATPNGHLNSMPGNSTNESPKRMSTTPTTRTCRSRRSRLRAVRFRGRLTGPKRSS